MDNNEAVSELVELIRDNTRLTSKQIDALYLAIANIV